MYKDIEKLFDIRCPIAAEVAERNTLMWNNKIGAYEMLSTYDNMYAMRIYTELMLRELERAYCADDILKMDRDKMLFDLFKATVDKQEGRDKVKV